MKRIITLLLIAAMAVALSACGSNQNSNSSDTNSSAVEEKVDTKAIRVLFDDAVSYTEANMDTSGMTASEQDNDGGKTLYKYWTYDDFVGNDEFSMDVEIDGNTVTIGTTTVGELKAMGFDVEVGAETLEPEQVTSVSVNKDGKFLNFSTEMNTSDAAKSVDEMVIALFYTAMYDSTLEFNYMNLSPDSTLKDVVAALGTTKYKAEVSADKDFTRIEVDYMNEVNDGATSATQVLMIGMLYDVDTDTARIVNIQLESHKN